MNELVLGVLALALGLFAAWVSHRRNIEKRERQLQQELEAMHHEDTALVADMTVCFSMPTYIREHCNALQIRISRIEGFHALPWADARRTINDILDGEGLRPISEDIDAQIFVKLAHRRLKLKDLEGEVDLAPRQPTPVD